jgi:hypothetical protein
MKRMRCMLIGILVAAVQPDLNASALQNSFDVVVPEPPSITVVEGKGLLVYELHLTNFSGNGQIIHALRVHDGASSRLLGQFVGPDLRSRESLVEAMA